MESNLVNQIISIFPEMIKPVLRNITIFPVKSLDGVSLQNAIVSEGGCLLHDREYAIIDEDGNFVNGKSNPLVHSLRSTIDFQSEIISFRPLNESSFRHFHLQKERAELHFYLSEYFGMKVILHREKTGRLMDIPDLAGVTVLSTESLKAVSTWFDISLEEARSRFRATLEIEGVPAFWEDRLFKNPQTRIEFKIGDVTVFGVSPRERCVVPSRNPQTGEVRRGFQKMFAQHREASVPDWSTLKLYPHYYFLSVDCLIPQSEIGKTISTGDELIIIGENQFY